MQPIRRTILHVDDDPQMLRILGVKLRTQGYDVVSLDDPARTIPALLDSHCRAVILDIDMPGVSGLEVLSQIKEYDGGVQVIMLTGLVSMNSVLESMRRGAEAVIFKPILDYDELYAALEAMFIKLHRWRHTLQELTRRRHECETKSVAQ
jgi:DNA-binding NtrC family response regulator